MADDPAARAAARTAVRTRILAPDVARGLALLGIAWANISTGWALADPGAPGAYFGGIRDGNMLDEVIVVLSAMFAHVRGLPMFTVLLGFGVGLITMSLSRRSFMALYWLICVSMFMLLRPVLAGISSISFVGSVR